RKGKEEKSCIYSNNYKAGTGDSRVEGGSVGCLGVLFFIGGEGICIVAAIFGGLVNIKGSSHVCELVLAPTPASSSTPASINRHVSPTRLPEPSENAMPYGRMRGGLV
nr:hypothetical protein [Tanacetum cinerariifolium]